MGVECECVRSVIGVTSVRIILDNNVDGSVRRKIYNKNKI
jgi:hypothetical protein